MTKCSCSCYKVTQNVFVPVAYAGIFQGGVIGMIGKKWWCKKVEARSAREIHGVESRGPLKGPGGV